MAALRRIARRSFVLCAAVALTMPRQTRAQTAAGTAWPQGLRDDYVTGGERNFRATGTPLFGPAVIAVGAYVYGSADAAHAAFPGVTTLYRNRLGSGGDDLQPTSATAVGDERAAFTVSGPAGAVALLGWRDGPVVYVAASGGMAGDQLTPLLDLAATITGRPLGTGPVATPSTADAPLTGGVWDLLPTLDELPAGFVFTGDEPMPAVATPVP